MNSKKLGKLVFTGLFAAMICVTTAFILHIPAANGYIHIGDSIIYIAACILPLPYGVAAAGIGGRYGGPDFRLSNLYYTYACNKIA